MGRWGRVVVCVAVAAACVVPAARADRLPTPAECDAGGAELLTLGEAPGALAVCVPGGTYAGGNPTYPCGTILVAGVPLVGTPDDDPAADCDAVDPLADELRYRIALPPGYSTETKRRWPVLYLLPGGGGDEHSWETVTPIVPQLTAMGLIVVLPYGGLTFHVDWEEGGPARAYERAFVERLMPTIDAQYRTMRDRKHRAIAGFSRGGYGAMLTAARHPHLFGAAASASGVPDIFGPARTEQLYLYAATLVTTPWYGDPLTNELGWRERNPTDLALALRSTDLWMSSGNGLPDADDPTDPLAAPSIVAETQVMLSTQGFSDELSRLGIAHHRDVHDGIHDYGNAGADVLRWARGWVAGGFGRPVPATFDLRNADPVFSAYGWTFRADGDRAPEFIDVSGTSAGGVTLTGSGRTTVSTPALFAPGQVVRVQVDGALLGVSAGGNGRLRFVVDLGPPHPYQQFTPESLGQQMVTKVVRLSPVV